MDLWSINTASQTSWPPFLFCTHYFWFFGDFSSFLLLFWIVWCIIWTLNKAIKEHNNSEHYSFFKYIFSWFFGHFSRFFRAFSTIRSGPRTLNTAHCSWFSEYKTKVISKFIYICLSVLKTNAIAKLSSKAILLHPSNPCRLLMEKLME